MALITASGYLVAVDLQGKSKYSRNFGQRLFFILNLVPRSTRVLYLLRFTTSKYRWAHGMYLRILVCPWVTSVFTASPRCSGEFEKKNPPICAAQGYPERGIQFFFSNIKVATVLYTKTKQNKTIAECTGATSKLRHHVQHDERIPKLVADFFCEIFHVFFFQFEFSQILVRFPLDRAWSGKGKSSDFQKSERKYLILNG
eukprot:SAG11_NODE_2704_length_3073_cov_4.296907_4_plen_200_part_00